MEQVSGQRGHGCVTEVVTVPADGTESAKVTNKRIDAQTAADTVAQDQPAADNA
jgi:hypothetical protein